LGFDMRSPKESLERVHASTYDEAAQFFQAAIVENLVVAVVPELRDVLVPELLAVTSLGVEAAPAISRK